MSTLQFQIRRDLSYSLAGTVFLALFGAVYEAFSHGVYSYFMLYAFAVPLLLGVVPYVFLLFRGWDPGRAARNLWNSGIAALSVGCVFKGVLDIYGTTNVLIAVYPILGGTLLLLGLICAPLHAASEKFSKSGMRSTFPPRKRKIP